MEFIESVADKNIYFINLLSIVTEISFAKINIITLFINHVMNSVLPFIYKFLHVMHDRKT